MENLNLIIVLLMLAVVINAILSAILFSRGLRNIFNILFGLISFGVAAWCIAISGFYSETLHSYTEWLTWTHSSALFIALIFLYFSNVFPEKLIKGKLFYIITALPFLAVLYYLFSDHTIVGKITGLEYEIGPGYIYYQILLIAYFLVGYCLLFLQYRRNKEPIRRQQIKYILIGSITASVLGMITDLIFPFLDIFNYTWLGPIFTVILVVSIFIAILRHNLFNIKVVITELFSLIVLVVLIVDAFSTGVENILILGIKSITLIVITIFLFLFIRGVYKTERLSEEKSEFVSFASHEIRSPLTYIKGVSADVLEGDFGEIRSDLKDALQKIFIRANEAVNLIAQYLDKSKLELKQLKYELADFDLKAIASQTIHNYQPSADQGGVSLKFTAEEGKDYTVSGDQAKIKEVLNNLVDNAIKFSPKGTVEVLLSKIDKTVLVKITDSGVGIPKETMSVLFRKFSRADNVDKAKIAGTGLGLFLSKTFVEAHHGKIWAESEGDGKGSSFFVELPVNSDIQNK